VDAFPAVSLIGRMPLSGIRISARGTLSLLTSIEILTVSPTATLAGDTEIVTTLSEEFMLLRVTPPASVRLGKAKKAVKTITDITTDADFIIIFLSLKKESPANFDLRP
jgi:hypothetical protein